MKLFIVTPGLNQKAMQANDTWLFHPILNLPGLPLKANQPMDKYSLPSDSSMDGMEFETPRFHMVWKLDILAIDILI